MSKLRHYQTNLKNKIYAAWGTGTKNILAVLPTGGGKTVIMGEIAKEFDGNGIFIAHRGELLGQISLQLARNGIYHNLITPKNSPLHRKICDLHLKKIGKNYINDRSDWLVGGVDTVINMQNDPRWRKIGLMITDEGHHVVKNNKWGDVFTYTPNAKLLAFTATPRRSDNKPLDIFDELVEGDDMRTLIDNGYLTDYRIVCPKTTDLDLSTVSISNLTGDYNLSQLKKAVHNSKRIVGDTIKEYLTHARDKSGVVFAVDVEHASEIAKEFKCNGITAEVVHAKTPAALRTMLWEQFEKRQILLLINVDLIGEGVDLPFIEVVIFARPTASYSLYVQQFGRVLRLFLSGHQMIWWENFTPSERKKLISESSKPFGLIIDQVGNVLKHGFPDTKQNWSLESKDITPRGQPSDKIVLRSCLNTDCLKVYSRNCYSCPYCGYEPPVPTGRLLPDMVDGDLTLLTEDILADMRREIKRIDDACVIPRNLEPHVKASIIRKHIDRQHAQKSLRGVIALWAGKYITYDDRSNHKRFYLTFGITVPEAKVLGVKEAIELENKILLTV